MKKYVPMMYVKSLFEINYDKLKEEGITTLIFDLDNTLIKKNSTIPSDDIVRHIKKLKDKFNVFILSNNISKKRVLTVSKCVDTPYISFAMKPLSRGFRFINKKYSIPYKEMCIIGDQILTDVFGGNRLGIFTILVEPLDGSCELAITSINRFIEKKIIRKMSKLGLFERGKYYE